MKARFAYLRTQVIIVTTTESASASQVYQEILDGYLVVCSDHPSENELGVAAFATNALLAPLPADTLRQARLLQFLELLRDGSVEQPPSTFRVAGRLLTEQIAAALRQEPARWILHEGFMVAPDCESDDQIVRLEHDLPNRALWSAPDVWRAWGSKREFRTACRNLLGDSAIAPGHESVVDDFDSLREAVERFRRTVDGPVIVKGPGIGGGGNVLIDGPETGELALLWKRVTADGRHTAVDVVIEQWLPWDHSYSVSYFMHSNQAPRPIAVCQQQVDTRLAKFTGSTIKTTLAPADMEALHEHVKPLFASMAANGYHGVAAIDVIVGSASTWYGHGLTLTCGAVVCLIECNPRFNRHNRVGLLIERLARRWDIPSDRLRWKLRDMYTDVVDSDRFAAETRDFLTVPALGTERRLRLADRGDRTMELTVSVPSHTG